jgi:leucyl/phenylalanyl-tRNA---protein transferase
VSRLPIPRLGADPDAPFPPAARALAEPNGLLAFGGGLQSRRLLRAYREGIFPWYAPGQPVLWWTPDPRMVFRTGSVHLPNRFRRTLRRCPWTVRADTAFDAVIAACASVPRAGQDGTWITDEMDRAYRALHRLGHAHSVEVFAGDAGGARRLVGGIYGIAIGRMFFGESMFSAESGGSKVALAALARRLHAWGFPLIDAQVENPHLPTLGAMPMPREAFLAEVARLTAMEGRPGSWTQAFGELAASALAAHLDEPTA